MPKHKLILLIILAIIIASLLIIGAKSGIKFEYLQEIVKNSGILAPIVFIIIYTIGPVLFIPITPLSITAGMLFGPIWGTIYSVLGATFGACATFLVSRYLMKEWIDKKSPGRVALVQKKVEEEGWKFIALARITPIFPFNVQNYIFGVTNISLRIFFLASLISLIPGAFAYVYIGYAGKEALSGNHNITAIIATAITILLLISLLPYILKRSKKALSKIVIFFS